MSDLQGLILLEKGKKIESMSISELAEFKQELIVYKPLDHNIQSKILDLFPACVTRIKEFEKQLTHEEPEEVEVSHPRDKINSSIEELTQKLKIPDLTEREKGILQRELEINQAAAKSWKKIDAEQEQERARRQQHLDLRERLEEAQNAVHNPPPIRPTTGYTGESEGPAPMALKR